MEDDRGESKNIVALIIIIIKSWLLLLFFFWFQVLFDYRYHHPAYEQGKKIRGITGSFNCCLNKEFGKYELKNNLHILK